MTSPVIFSVYVGLGSNLGDRKRNIEAAIRRVGRLPGVALEKVSSLYETEPVGGPTQRDHYNAVMGLSVSVPPADFLKQLKEIERSMGRRRSGRWHPRLIDLDLLTYGRKKITGLGLKVPHPRYHERRFVLVPFSEVAPNFKHPRLKRANSALLRQLTPLGQRVTMLSEWKKTRFYRSKKRKKTANRSLR